MNQFVHVLSILWIFRGFWTPALPQDREINLQTAIWRYVDIFAGPLALGVLDHSNPISSLIGVYPLLPYLGLKSGNPVCQAHGELVAVQSKAA